MEERFEVLGDAVVTDSVQEVEKEEKEEDKDLNKEETVSEEQN